MVRHRACWRVDADVRRHPHALWSRRGAHFTLSMRMCAVAVFHSGVRARRGAVCAVRRFLLFCSRERPRGTRSLIFLSDCAVWHGVGAFSRQFEALRRIQTTELWEHHEHKNAVEQYALEACKYQSSCNLTKQIQAKKAKKSLNIIHIGNICNALPPSRCLLAVLSHGKERER
jgi:hypothetical protein